MQGPPNTVNLWSVYLYISLDLNSLYTCKGVQTLATYGPCISIFPHTSPAFMYVRVSKRCQPLVRVSAYFSIFEQPQPMVRASVYFYMFVNMGRGSYIRVYVHTHVCTRVNVHSRFLRE